MLGFIKKACFISIGWFLGLIFVLVAFEVGLRIIYPESKNELTLETIAELGLEIDFEYDYNISDVYESEESTVNYKRDQYGFRNSCGDPKNIDILSVGGSTTAQRYVRDESTFQTVIEKLVKDETGKEICVANAGYSGHSTHAHKLAFEKWFPALPDLNPKYVMLYVGINDANFKKKQREDRIIKGWIRKTYLAKKTRPFFNYTKGKIEAIKNPNVGYRNANYIESDYTATELADDTIDRAEQNAIGFKKRFKGLLEQVDAMGAEPICLTQPNNFVRIIDGKKYGIPKTFYGYGGLDYDYSLQEINKMIKELCKENTIDIYAAEFVQGMFHDGTHTTDIGSEFLGNEIFKAMKQKGMLELF